MTCGQRIKEERQKRHMSQEDLAERLEVSRQAVSKWEADTARPTREKREQLSELLGLSPDIWTAPPPPEQKALGRWKIAAAVLAVALCLTWILGLVLWPWQAERFAAAEEVSSEEAPVSEDLPLTLPLQQRRDFDFGNWPLGEYSLDNAPLLKDPEWIQDHCRWVGNFNSGNALTPMEVAWADPREESGATLYNAYLVYAHPDEAGRCDWQILFRMAEGLDEGGIAQGLSVEEFSNVLGHDGFKVTLDMDDMGIWSYYIIPDPDGVPRLMYHTAGAGAVEYDVDEDGQLEIVSADIFRPSTWEITNTVEGMEGAVIYTLSGEGLSPLSLQFVPEMGGFVIAEAQNVAAYRYLLQGGALVRVPITDISARDYPDVAGTQIDFVTDAGILSDDYGPDDVIYSGKTRVTHRQQAYLALQELYDLTGLTVEQCYCAANEYGVVFSLLSDGFDQRSFYSASLGEDYGNGGIPGLDIIWKGEGNNWSPLSPAQAQLPEKGTGQRESLCWYYDRLGILAAGELDHADAEELYLKSGDSYLFTLQDTQWGYVLTSLRGPYPGGEIDH